MKYLNKILITLVGLLLLFVVDASAEVGGDLNLQNKASLSSRTGYNLNLSTQGSSDSINFIVAGSSKGTVGSAGFSGLTLVSPTLTSPTISGNLTFSTAAAKIIPGATSLTFRNNADSASNLAITDAGTVTTRNDINVVGTSDNFHVKAQANSIIVGFTALGAGGGAVGTDSNHSTALITNNVTRWTVGTDGTFTQEATNGGSIIMAKTPTASSPSLLIGVASQDADISYVSNVLVANPFLSIPLGVISNGANAGGDTIYINKTRSAAGDASGNTIVNASDYLGSILWQGSDGTDYAGAAKIVVTVDGTPGNNDMPGAIDFQTSPDGSQTPTSRLKITEAGKLAFPAGNATLLGSVSGTTGNLTIAGGTHASASVGSYVIVNGNTHANTGLLDLQSGNVSGSNVNIGGNHSTSVINFSPGTLGAWQMEADGDLAGNASNGGHISITKPSRSLSQPVVNTISAAGTTTSDATALTGVINYVTTVAAGTGVKLWEAPTGSVIYVHNLGANALLVYPPTSGQIYGYAVDTGASIAVNSTAVCTKRAASAGNSWYCGELPIA